MVEGNLRRFSEGGFLGVIRILGRSIGKLRLCIKDGSPLKPSDSIGQDVAISYSTAEV